MTGIRVRGGDHGLVPALIIGGSLQGPVGIAEGKWDRGCDPLPPCKCSRPQVVLKLLLAAPLVLPLLRRPYRSQGLDRLWSLAPRGCRASPRLVRLDSRLRARCRRLGLRLGLPLGPVLRDHAALDHLSQEVLEPAGLARLAPAPLGGGRSFPFSRRHASRPLLIPATVLPVFLTVL